MARASAVDKSDSGLLRIVACGSVDDGKSTLVGRLLAETGSLPVDYLEAMTRLSRRYGSAGDDLDYALLLDGLEAEREQGITIDVAYRYFATPRRNFIVADTPGHEQYTRNMVTGCSNAELAMLLVDARNGLTVQTMRHSRIAALLGIRHVLLVINKMDLVGFSEAAFAAIQNSYVDFANSLNFSQIAAIPTSARFGDNVVEQSKQMAWYSGPAVLDFLETVQIKPSIPQPLRFTVQSVIRAAGDFRSYAGIVLSGTIAQNDEIIIARSGDLARVARIATFDGDLARANTGQAISLVLDNQTDIGRGDIIAHPDTPPEVTDQFAAHLVWLDRHPLLPGRTYTLQLGTQLAAVTVTAIKHKIEIETGGQGAGRTLEANEIGVCNISSATPVSLDPYDKIPATGAFILIDRATASTVGAGMVDFALRRASNIKPQRFMINKMARAHMKGQRPCIVWFTGLPGAGKSTIMNLVEQRLSMRGVHTYALDGDNLRQGLSRDLGFSDADRVENIRRAGEVARLMVDSGLVVLCAFISPFEAERQMVRELVEPDEFIEVFVDTPVEICMARDPKGLYAKAREGRVFHVTGLDSPYEAPKAPDMRLETVLDTAEVLADRVVDHLGRKKLIDR